LAFRETDHSLFQDLSFIVELKIHNQSISHITSFSTLIFPSFMMKVTKALLVAAGLLAASISALPITAENSALERRFTLSSPAATTESDEPPADYVYRKARNEAPLDKN
jgi:hypothetical protein